VRSIETTYNGKEYKSRLEANIAMIITRIGYAYEYEPISFLLPSGTHYWPDFYVPSIHLWIEGRGYETEKGQQQIDEFSKLIAAGFIMPNKTISQISDFGLELLPFEELNKKDAPDYLILKYDGARFVEYQNRYGYYGGPDDAIALVRCGHCKRYYFIGQGSCQCRFCNTWEGNSHIDRMYYFSNINELKEIISGGDGLGHD
jgi:hypothetical protein